MFSKRPRPKPKPPFGPIGGTLQLTGKGRVQVSMPDRLVSFSSQVDSNVAQPSPSSASSQAEWVRVELKRDRLRRRSKWHVDISWDVASVKEVTYWGSA